MGFRVRVSGFRVYGLLCRMWDVGRRVQGSGFRGVGLRVKGSGLGCRM